VPGTRRQFVARSAGALATLTVAGRPAAALAAAGPTAPPTSRFLSRPDLDPPAILVDHAAPGTAGGYVLLAPFVGQAHGTALIVDETGEPVWIRQTPQLIMNFRVQQFRGAPVLTWWEGTVKDGLFAGECVIADDTYFVIERISAGNGFVPEVHEFLLTDNGTALISINNLVTTDLTPYGGPADSYLVEGVVQELEVGTGRVLFEWHSLDHVSPAESSFPPGPAWDYFHLNSIDVDPSDGNLLISARYPCAIYKVDRTTGDVIWRLGGTKSDFTLGPDAAFFFQHDARALPNDAISLFDDGADAPDNAPEPVSRAVVLQLDTDAMTATLVQAHPNPSGSLTFAMGNAQSLATGGTFVGWGTVPQVTEFAADGSVVFNATFAAGQSSYRAYRAQWPGRAADKPAVAAVPSGKGLAVYASWNGATRVTHWRVLAGPSPDALVPMKTLPRTGFETKLPLASRAACIAVAALDAKGAELGRSKTVNP